MSGSFNAVGKDILPQLSTSVQWRARYFMSGWGEFWPFTPDVMIPGNTRICLAMTLADRGR